MGKKHGTAPGFSLARFLLDWPQQFYLNPDQEPAANSPERACSLTARAAG